MIMLLFWGEWGTENREFHDKGVFCEDNPPFYIFS